MTRRHIGPWSFDDEPPARSERLTIAWLEWALDALSKLSCSPHPSSRFPESLRYLRRVHANSSTLEDPETRAQLAEIQRSAWELLIIVIATIQTERDISPFTREKLEEMFGGGLSADDSHARNTQYELYVPALFVIGQFDVRRGSPDSQVRIFDEYLGVEAKRIRSTNSDTLRRTLSRAARQVVGQSSSQIIEVVQYRGLIAINLDGLFESVDVGVEQDELVREFETQLAVLDRETRVLENKHGIVGLLATGHVARWRQITEPKHWRIDTLYAFRWVGVHGDDPADVALTYQVRPQMDRLQKRVLALRTKVPKPILGPILPVA